MRLALSTIALVACTSLASAADLGGPYGYDGSLKDEPYAAAPIWTGLYVGAHAGYGWGEWDGRLISGDSDPGFRPTNERKLDGDGWLGGGQVGFNGQSGRWVWGAEADVSWSGLNGSDTYDTWVLANDGWVEDPPTDHNTGSFSKRIKSELEVFGTVRARLGMLITPSMLLYGTGGLAWGRTSSDMTVVYTPYNLGVEGDSRVSATGSVNENHVGWTVGGGAEWMLSSQLAVKAEYLYVDLGEERYGYVGKTSDGSPYSGDGFPADLAFHTFRVGVNYKFGH